LYVSFFPRSLTPPPLADPSNPFLSFFFPDPVGFFDPPVLSMFFFGCSWSPFLPFCPCPCPSPHLLSPQFPPPRLFRVPPFSFSVFSFSLSACCCPRTFSRFFLPPCALFSLFFFSTARFPIRNLLLPTLSGCPPRFFPHFLKDRPSDVVFFSVFFFVFPGPLRAPSQTVHAFSPDGFPGGWHLCLFDNSLFFS